MPELLFPGSALADGPWLDALLRATLRGAVLLACAGAATLLLRGASAAARHLVWTLAFAGLLALPLLPPLVPAVEVPLPAAPVALPELEVPLRVAVAADPLLLSGAPAGGWPAAPAPAAEIHDAALAVEWTALLLPAWLAGAGLVLGSLLLGLLRVRREGRRSGPVTAGPAVEMLERLRVETGVRRRVSLHHGDAAAMPMTWGTLRPRILLPAGAEGWPAPRLRAVLLHELAHVRRGDALTQLVVEAACALYWFNPLVWAAARRLRAESEHACDDQVLRAGSRPSDYAEHLLQVARTLRAAGGGRAAAVAMARPAQIRGRLLAVLSEGRRRGPVSRRFAVPMLLGASGAVALLAALSPAARGEAAPVDAAASGRVETGTSAAPAVRPAADGASLRSAAGPDGAPEAAAAPAATPAVAAAARSSSRCPDTGGFSRHDEDRDGRRQTTWHNQRGCGGRAESVGRVGFSGDRADVARVAPGGRFAIELYDGGDRQRAEILPAAGGGLRRTFTVNGRAREWDAGARRWLAGALGEYFRATRVTPPAPPAEESSGERAARLVDRAHDGSQGPTELRRIAADAARLESDGDRARVLREVVARSAGSPGVLAEVIAATRTFDSDGERASVLAELASRHGLRSAGVRRAFYASLAEMESNGEQRGVLAAVAARGGLDPAGVIDLLRATEAMESSSEKAAVLLDVAGRGLVSEAVRPTYRSVAATIESDWERERALRAVGAAGAREASRSAGSSSSSSSGSNPGATTSTSTRTTTSDDGQSTTSLSWSDSGSGRAATMEARNVDVGADGGLRIRPGGYLVIDEAHGSFRQRVRVEPGPDGRLRRSYTGGSVEPSRRLEWEAALVARFSDRKQTRW